MLVRNIERKNVKGETVRYTVRRKKERLCWTEIRREILGNERRKNETGRNAQKQRV